jgi:hypothetical protein
MTQKSLRSSMLQQEELVSGAVKKTVGNAIRGREPIGTVCPQRSGPPHADSLKTGRRVTPPKSLSDSSSTSDGIETAIDEIAMDIHDQISRR